MSDKIYRIAKWQETFETADSRRHKVLTWVSLPIGCDSSGYLSLVDEFGDQAAEIYGAWCALLSVAARSPTRGQLVDSRSRPYTISRIATQTHLRKDIFEKLFAWASLESVGWLEVMSTNDGLSSDDQPTNDSQTVDKRQANELPNVTEPNLTKPNNDRTLGDRSTDFEIQESIEFSADWFEGVRGRANSVLDSVRNGLRKAPTTEDRKLAIAAVAFESQLGIDLNPILDSLNRKRNSETVARPWGYVRSSLKKACEDRSLDFHKLYNAFAVPEEVISPPAQPVS